MDFFSMPPHRGYKAVLVLLDLFSGYTWILACRNESAQTVKTHLTSLFQHFGTPELIKSDGGTGLLKSKAVKALLREFNILQVSINAANAPKHNAAVERQVRTVRHLLRGAGFRNTKDWVSLIPKVTLAKNLTPRVYGKDLIRSPFEIFFGRKSHVGMITPQSLVNSCEIDPQVKRQLDRDILSAVKRQREAYMAQHNAKARPRFQVGDLVVVRNQYMGTNLEAEGKQGLQYKNILYVVRSNQGTAAILENIANGSVVFVHDSYIKRFKGREEYFDDLPDDLKKVIGGSFDTNLDLGDRANLLESLRKAGFECPDRTESVPPALSTQTNKASEVRGPLADADPSLSSQSTVAPPPTSVKAASESSGPPSVNGDSDASSSGRSRSLFQGIKSRLRKLRPVRYTK